MAATMSLPAQRMPLARRTSRSTVRARAVVGGKAVEDANQRGKGSGFCYGLPGNVPPTGNFDPLSLSGQGSQEDVRRYREAEITHGRVAMLAAIGILVGENFQLFFKGIVTEKIAVDQFQEVPGPFWQILVLLIGIAEAYRARRGWEDPGTGFLFKLRDDYAPGNLNFDPLGISPEGVEEFRDKQAKEINNGRLAMISVAIFVVQEKVSGEPVLSQIAEGLGKK